MKPCKARPQPKVGTPLCAAMAMRRSVKAFDFISFLLYFNFPIYYYFSILTPDKYLAWCKA